MEIELQNIKIRDVIDGYEDNGEGGVVGYGGKLNIRPAFQREFIYQPKERDAVIRTVCSGFPLNTMYWSSDDTGTFELMDGQQRTVSICQYVHELVPVRFDDGHEMGFENLPIDQQNRFLDYELSVYICKGEMGEKLAWFRTINIAGKPLNNQELLNAMHTGPWLADAKRIFSQTGGPAYKVGHQYVRGLPIRQDYLAKALAWISSGNVEGYMNRHQWDDDAQELWQYFQEVIAWVQRVFPHYRSSMRGVEWGDLYNVHKGKGLNAKTLEDEIAKLVLNSEVGNKKGIYEYVLTGDERTLNLRAFDESMKAQKYEEQQGICPMCREHFDLEDMEADHITPWSSGGRTIIENCQMLCKDDNRRKSDR